MEKELHFYGLIAEEALADYLPEEDGIYMAFSGHVVAEQQIEITHLLYIGKASGTDPLSKRVPQHIPEHKGWLKKAECAAEEIVVYQYAELKADENLRDVEAALIYRLKPVGNKNDVENYNGDVVPLTVKCCTEFLTNHKVGMELKIDVTYQDKKEFRDCISRINELFYYSGKK